ncbi:hypothetical protein [Flavihumibacter petaseus]|uniref:DUF1795 domain-containing protein n=1 Tax=Flavihumibacter petaseus NBRC 106054 TaxID=1220578 RepID=A0A0E9N4R4_9BACT|nr:hypothetical protein [Flavihumibacter petaseus]GAO44788.1 hypothetical protein FPE01S_04_00310 [Flavihumibacter petaseus NBRC 106054]
MGIWNSIFGQKAPVTLSTYENKEANYSIQYPEGWKIETDEAGVLSITSDKFKGGIFISVREGLTFPDQHMEDLILQIEHLPAEWKPRILHGVEKGIRSWYISYTASDHNLTCMSIYKRKGDRLWFVSTETETGLWKNGWNDIIKKILTSFEIASA